MTQRRTDDQAEYNAARAEKYAHLDYKPTNIPGHAIWIEDDDESRARCSCGWVSISHQDEAWKTKKALARHLEAKARSLRITA